MSTGSGRLPTPRSTSSNVYLDISGYQSTLRADGAATVVKKAVSRGINHKVLFGTDWPVLRLKDTQEGFVTAVTADDSPLSDLNATSSSSGTSSACAPPPSCADRSRPEGRGA
ncbi:amidohydrolase family protein [Corallococcus llansteffanensis]|uniref:Amidohydrolase-related domain-containing protein n=1 Tax=Corallococcus llansteffanensis TaxID=2316731 RepID=A0A3A8NPK6_9BACT|nr:amidohydrolase family protein [Corallococcus llansteffanensis]RKH43085.1 hypothetical protein D7V93_37335 [Corallococcus llansteffanensis]